MIVVTNAELAQSYRTHARTLRRYALSGSIVRANKSAAANRGENRIDRAFLRAVNGRTYERTPLAPQHAQGQCLRRRPSFRAISALPLRRTSHGRRRAYSVPRCSTNHAKIDQVAGPHRLDHQKRKSLRREPLRPAETR